MIKVLLICSQGASTAIMCDRIQKAAEQRSIEMDVHAVPLAVSADHILNADVILIGPQIRYMKNKIMESAEGKPVSDIEMQTYGLMDGEKVFEQILEMIK